MIKIYKKDGTIEEIRIDKNKNKLSSITNAYDDDGSLKEIEKNEYYQNGKYSMTYINNINSVGWDDIKFYEFREYDNNGNIKKAIPTDFNTQENMYNRNILKYEQFSLNEANELANLSDKKWEIAEKYLKKKPNASYNEINKEINKS